MDWSHFFARLLGIYLLILVAIWLTRKETFEKGARDIISSESTFALTGVLQILIGLTIAILHPVWDANWRILITLIGYLAIIQGIIRLSFPVQCKQYFLKSFEKGHWILITIAALLGAILTYNGFTH